MHAALSHPSPLARPRGRCYSLADCYGRSQGNLGSSTKLPPTGSMGGLLSDDCTVSPLCNYNVVWLAYLDGNSFSGMLEGPVNFTTPSGASAPLWFRGRHNIDAVVDAVSRNVMGAAHLLKDAVDVVETGCSAGGLATYLHADYIASVVPRSGAYYSLPISGYFLDYPSVANGSFVYSQQIAAIYAISNASTNAACQSAHEATGDAWRCNMAEYVYPFIQANVFILNSKCASCCRRQPQLPSRAPRLTPSHPFPSCLRARRRLVADAVHPHVHARARGLGEEWRLRLCAGLGRVRWRPHQVHWRHDPARLPAVWGLFREERVLCQCRQVCCPRQWRLYQLMPLPL